MAYTIKVLRIAEYPEWQHPEDRPDQAAGPGVEGSWLARRVTISVGNGVAELHQHDLFVPEPYSTEWMQQAVADYVGTLPERHPDEGMELAL